MEYRELVRELAESRSSKMVNNSSIEHAAVLFSEMFRRNSGHAAIFSGSLNRALYSRAEILDAIGIFLSDSSSSLHVVVQEASDGVDNFAFLQSQIHKKWGDEAAGRLEGRVADSDAADVGFHFATVGESAFRFESDRTKHEAFASFGRPEHVKTLKAVFQRAWNSATKIEALESQPA